MLILLVLTIAGSSLAPAQMASSTNSLVVPVFLLGPEHNNANPLPVSDFNKRLREANRPEVPANAVFTIEAANNRATVGTLNRLIGIAVKFLGGEPLDYELARESFPGQHLKTFKEEIRPGNSHTCYTGEPVFVRHIVHAMGGSYYDENMKEEAVRYGEEFWTDDAADKKTIEELREWREYNTSSDTVLLVTLTGEQSNERNVSLIPRCR